MRTGNTYGERERLGPTSAIFCVATNGVMGDSRSFNGLPWVWPADIRRFRQLTEGGIVAMGRKTWEAMRSRPLQNRENVVITTSAKTDCIEDHGDHKRVGSVYDVIQLYRHDSRPLWFIGGPAVLDIALVFCEEVELSILHEAAEGDVHLPASLLEDWRMSKVEWADRGMFLKLRR